MLPIGRALGAVGLTPNALTAMGLVLNVAAAAVIASGSYAVGALAFITASAFDSLDGAVARATGQVSRFGAFFDSVADRYAEAAVLFGLMGSLILRGDLRLAAATAVALLGSLMVSYARARAEGLGVDCEIGLLQRTERVFLLTVGLLFSDLLLAPAIWILAVVTNLTVIQRTIHVHRQLSQRDT